MNLNIIAFGIVRDIVGGNEFEIKLPEDANVADLKKALCAQYSAFEKLTSFAIAVDEEYREDDYLLEKNKEVVIIPPVSGG